MNSPAVKLVQWSTTSIKEQRHEQRRERLLGEVEQLGLELEPRPQKRSDCKDGIRPCPYLGCRYHLALDVTDAGSLQQPDADLDDLEETCSLDVADRGGMTLEAVGSLLGVTRERIRQIEEMAARKLRVRLDPEIVP